MSVPSGNRPPRRAISCLSSLAVLPVVALLGLLAWGAIALMNAATPRISAVPVLRPGAAALILQGSGFGSGGQVLFSRAGESWEPLRVTSWSGGQVQAELPAGTSNGLVRVQVKGLLGSAVSAAHEFITARQAQAQAPTQPGSPWPTFRRDPQNTGRSPLAVQYAGDQPWAFQTGKGLFVTPIVAADGSIYVGSADHFFYALNPDGTLQWKYETGEIIDSAGALLDAAPGSGEAPLVFISGDGSMYGFRLDEGIPNPADRLVWKYTAELRKGISFNRWFEGNVAVGPDGTLYAGNTNFLYYAISPDGRLKWTYPTGSNNWSMAAFGRDGTIYWGSLDTFIHAVAPSGKPLWTVRTLGFIGASAAVGSDGTVYIGSFDSNLYALDPASGEVRWKFPTQDHIYSSAALGQDLNGGTNAIYFGSADGSLYAVSPAGKLLWRYDTGDPIRSSPAVGLAPDSDSEVVYFGSGNGKLYALNAADGSLRWSFDTTPADPELRDRNDLNGSPALGKTGVYIGGEHGYLDYVPYDYCLHASDARCSTAKSDLPGRLSQAGGKATQVGLFYVTPGGSTSAQFPETLPVSSLITLRLVSVKDGQTQPATVCNSPLGCPADDLRVTLSPDVPFSVDHSADGRYVYIRPQGFLPPATEFQLSVSGRVYSGGLRLGNLTLFGSPGERFSSAFHFKTPPSSGPFPLQVSEGRTSALEWSRMAAPLPPMLPSLNQIGFDYIDWILGTVLVTPPDGQGRGKAILWAVGARRGADGSLQVDPQSDFALPLSGVYQGDSFLLADQHFNMAITGINIPFNRFEVRGQLGANGIVAPGASAFADTDALSIPKFGPYLVAAGLANNVYQKMLVEGTYITRPYPAGGTANQAPAGVQAGQVQYQPPSGSREGRVSAAFSLAPGTVYTTREHLPAILLVDPQQNEVVFLDYHALLSSTADSSGNLQSVTLKIPAGTKLPARLQAVVLLDVYPLASREIIP